MPYKDKEKQREYCKEYYLKNKDKAKEYRLKNKDKLLKRSKEYNQKNKNNIKEYYKDYRIKNKDNIKEYWKRYNEYEYGKLIKRKSSSKRKLKLKGYIHPVGISIEDQRKIIRRDKVCVYDGSNEKLTIDHIDPVDNGGLNNFNNLVLACGSCNYSKKVKNVFEWCKEKGIKIPNIVLELLQKQQEQTNLKGGNANVIFQKEKMVGFQRSPSESFTEIKT